MGDILIQNIPSQGITTISNQFIDQYMPKANGEFVKVYLYLLRITQGACRVSLAAIADVFDCTERDVVRALRYWEKAGLLKLTCENHKLSAIAFCPIPSKAAISPENSQTEAAAAITQPESSTLSAKSSAAESSKEPTSTVELPKKKPLTANQKKVLQEQEEVRQFLYIAEQYLGRTLSKMDIDNLLYFYSELHFSEDLIEYLVEYCVSKGSRSTRYIETVALAWASEGISTVEEAKKATNLFHKNYFTILKAMGIKGRSPVEMEQKMMDSWMQELGFTLDIITEACQRTVMQIGQASFPYTDSILRGWHQKGVKHLNDVAPLDQDHKKKAAKSAAKERTGNSSSKRQTEYPHRSYDYEEIKRSLFKQ